MTLIESIFEIKAAVSALVRYISSKDTCKICYGFNDV